MIVRLVHLLLRLAPRDFRRRFGTEMLDTARHLDAERPRRPARLARAAIDACVTPFAIRRDLRRETRSRQPHARSAPLSALVSDCRFAARGLRREPGFALFVCTAIALGIGANGALFSVADRMLLSGPAHVRDPGRVVRLETAIEATGEAARHSPSFGHVTYALLSERARSFDGLATYTVSDALLGRGDNARRIRLGYGSASLFPLLGTRPGIGRFFTEDEDSPGGARQVVVLSDGAWRNWFGAATDVLGRTVAFGDDTFTVIGVALPGFTGPQFSRVDAWVPMNVLSPRVTQDFQTAWTAQWLQIAGRLAPGVSPQDAEVEATKLYREGYAGPRTLPEGLRIRAAALRAVDLDFPTTEVYMLGWLAVVGVIILLVACANVANLLLVRSVRRAREVAVRAALGAGRLRLIRLLVLEAMLLAAAGALLGLGVAYVVGGVATNALFDSVAWPGPPIAGRTFIAVAALAVLVGLLTGLVPAVRASRTTLAGALQVRAGVQGGSRSGVRTVLTIAQATLSVVLLIGAGLFLRSLDRIHALDLGIDADRVYVVELSWPPLGNLPEGPIREAERARRKRFYIDELASVRSVPGVEGASVAVGMPFGYLFRVQVRGPDHAPLPKLGSDVPSVSAVASRYFETVGTAIIQGRAFGETDGFGTEPVAIVNATMARTVWPNDDALGQCLFVGEGNRACARIVGIAEDTHRSRLRETPFMHYYIPAGQESGFGGSALLVRTSDRAGAVMPAVRRLLAADDPAISYLQIETVQDRIDPQIEPWRQGAVILVGSATLALLVAGIGVFSVVSYLVAGRRREIAVRLAVGAQPRDVTRLVLRGSLPTTLAGVCAGGGLVILCRRLIEPVLFDVSPADPIVYLATGGLVIGVAIAASLVPARRARRVSPAEVLKLQ